MMLEDPNTDKKAVGQLIHFNTFSCEALYVDIILFRCDSAAN
jgi:hypothetical protein